MSSNDDEVPASDVEQGGIMGGDLWVEQDSAGGSDHLGECCDHHDEDGDGGDDGDEDDKDDNGDDKRGLGRGAILV